jgi:hypothetical protein
LALGVLVAGDNFILRDLAVDRAGLLVLDPGTALRVELVELDRAALAMRGVGFDRDGNERELEKTFQVGCAAIMPSWTDFGHPWAFTFSAS